MRNLGQQRTIHGMMKDPKMAIKNIAMNIKRKGHAGADQPLFENTF